MPRLNLRAKLLLFAIVIAIIPLLIAGQSLIRIARDEMKSSANDQLVTTARQVTGQINDLFEHAYAPLLLIRNAIDEPGLGVQEKIALLTHGIADLPDVVALQISVEGRSVPIVVVQDHFAADLKAASLQPLAVLRTPAEKAVEILNSGNDRDISIEHIDGADKWLATVVLPLKSPIGNARGVFSAKIDLSSIRSAIADNPFERTGRIVVVDSTGRQVLDSGRANLTDLAIVTEGLSLLGKSSQVISVESYTNPDGTAMLGAFAFPDPIDWMVLVEKSEADAYYAVGVMIRSLGTWLAAGLAAAAAGALIFALRISGPILKIGQAAIEVGKGNFQAHVSGVRSRDEIGDLAERINTMIVQINERFQLAKFVSGGTMSAIQKSGHTGVKLGGERRAVAALFADIRGYTHFAEPRAPEEVVEVLNFYFQRMADLVTQNRGDVDKFVGDQIMAIFHEPTMAVDSVACALAIQDAMVELGLEHPEWGLDIGIGIDMGEVVMGAMGSNQRMDYTVLGDHVNLAARLCSHAAPRQTIISEAVGEEVAGTPGFRLDPLDPIRVKGKSAALAVYSVHRATMGAAEPPAGRAVSMAKTF